MVQVFPFRALRYDPKVVGSLTEVTSQPYDRIDEALQQKYYNRHPTHIVRIIRGKDEPTDGESENRYTRSKEFLDGWLQQGVLVNDVKPAFYAYRQVYNTPGGHRTRRGLTAMVRLEEPGKGRILPHEQTHIGPKVDRFKLLNQTMAHFEHVFLLYSDPERKVNAILDRRSHKAAPLHAMDDLGETHEAWPVTEDIGQIQELMGPKVAIIADGHHRYETAYKFMLDLKRAGAKVEGHESYLNVLATLINMDDEGLTLFPTHRLVDRCRDWALFKQQLSGLFEVRSYPPDGPALERALRASKFPAFGIIEQNSPEFLLAVLRDPEEAVKKIWGSWSREWKLLDVNILHSLILHPLLGVTSDDLDHERRVAYRRHTQEVIDAVRRDKSFQIGLLVKPCTLEQIRTLTQRGERFPQKTTDFYPKLLSGFIMCRLDVSREGLERLK